jgi:prophage regulatory protein
MPVVIFIKGAYMKFEEKFITLHDVVQIVGFKKSTIYKMIRKGFFPSPVKIGRSSRWKMSEIRQWMENVSSV